MSDLYEDGVCPECGLAELLFDLQSCYCSACSSPPCSHCENPVIECASCGWRSDDHRIDIGDLDERD